MFPSDPSIHTQTLELLLLYIILGLSFIYKAMTIHTVTDCLLINYISTFQLHKISVNISRFIVNLIFKIFSLVDSNDISLQYS